MDAYDWDKTIFRYDTTVKFYLYCLRRYPAAWLSAFWSILVFVRYALHLGQSDWVKGRFFRFLTRIPRLDEAIADFWAIYTPFVARPSMPVDPRPGDVAISASPRVLIEPAAQRLGMHLIATEYDTQTAQLRSKICYGAEKVARWKAEFGDVVPETFYSDSRSDTPMAQLARSAYQITHGERVPW